LVVARFLILGNNQFPNGKEVVAFLYILGCHALDCCRQWLISVPQACTTAL